MTLHLQALSLAEIRKVICINSTDPLFKFYQACFVAPSLIREKISEGGILTL